MRKLNLVIRSCVYQASANHSRSLKLGIVEDISVANNIISGYSKCGLLGVAHQVFDKMPQRDIVSWNAMISGYVNFGNSNASWGLFIEMRRQGISVDGYTFSSLLKGIASNGELLSGQQLHAMVFKMGSQVDVVTGSSLLVMYAKCGRIDDAHTVFKWMPMHNSVSWNAIISGYVNYGNSNASWDLFIEMRWQGISVDGCTFSSLLKGIASNGELLSGQQLHAMVFKMGSQVDVVTGNSLLVMYAKCGRIDDAHMVFKWMPLRVSISWNAMIAGYVASAEIETALQLLVSMEKEGIKIEDGTVAPFLTLLNEPEFFKLTMQLHGKIIKSGLISNNVVCNAILTSYSECGSLENAENVFRGAFDVHDLVTWNFMLAAYLLHHEEKLALKLYLQMQDCGFVPDIYTYTSILTACFDDAYHVLGKCFHCLIVKTGLESSTTVSNTLIAIYLKMGGKSTADALRLFEAIDQKDSVSWNSILTGFSQLGNSEDAVTFFGNMRSRNVGIDHYSLSAVLRSSADLAALHLGRQVHALSLKSCLHSNERVASSLILMYSKCGLLDNARKSFEDTSKDSPITWNFLIFGYSQHGHGKVAFELFHQMTTEYKVNPDHITFVAILTACNHMGWVEEGQLILKSMESVYKIPLRMEHYTCAIDLFGRAGLMNEAKALLKSMPFEPDTMVWKTVLEACRNCGDIEFASQVASHLLKIDPEEHCTYVIMSDMYARLKMWEEKGNLSRLMRERRVKKVPGWSWIEINNETHAFNVEDSNHAESKEIYDILDILMEEIRMLKIVSKIEDSNESWDSFI